LVEALCPAAVVPALCEEILNNHWAHIGEAFYPVFFEDDFLCWVLGVCSAHKEKDLVKEWTCEECTDAIAGIADFMISQVRDITEILKVLKAS
jgi:hypothetical protein